MFNNKRITELENTVSDLLNVSFYQQDVIDALLEELGYEEGECECCGDIVLTKK